MLIQLDFCIALLITKVLLLITCKSCNYLYSANIISDVRSCGDGLQKISKSNKRRIFGQSWQGRWIFLLNLELEEALFHAKLKYHRSYVLSEPYHCKEKKNYMLFKVSTITEIVKFVESIDITLKVKKLFLLQYFHRKNNSIQ